MDKNQASLINALCARIRRLEQIIEQGINITAGGNTVKLPIGGDLIFDNDGSLDQVVTEGSAIISSKNDSSFVCDTDPNLNPNLYPLIAPNLNTLSRTFCDGSTYQKGCLHMHKYNLLVRNKDNPNSDYKWWSFVPNYSHPENPSFTGIFGQFYDLSGATGSQTYYFNREADDPGFMASGPDFCDQCGDINKTDLHNVCN